MIHSNNRIKFAVYFPQHLNDNHLATIGLCYIYLTPYCRFVTITKGINKISRISRLKLLVLKYDLCCIRLCDLFFAYLQPTTASGTLRWDVRSTFFAADSPQRTAR